jgi:hypothetical protein
VHMVWMHIKALRQHANFHSNLHSHGVVTLTCTTEVAAVRLAQPDPAAVVAAGLACAAGSSGPAQSPVPWLDVACHGNCGS